MAWWARSIDGSVVAGDAFVGFECAATWLRGGGWPRPSQPIFGYGICLSHVPLLLGADSLDEVLVRRAWVGGVIPALGWLLARAWAGRFASPAAARWGATALGFALLRSALLYETTTRGGHGYFAPTCTTLALTAWAMALCWRPRLSPRAATALVVFGCAAAAFAPMNHPHGAWVFPALAVLLLPLWRGSRTGLIAGLGLAVLLLAPEILRWLGHFDADPLDQARAGQEAAVPLVAVAREAFAGTGRPFALGGLALATLALAPTPAREPCRRWLGVLVVGALGLLVLRWLADWLKPYHLVGLLPVLGLGLAGAAGLAFDRASIRGRGVAHGVGAAIVVAALLAGLSPPDGTLGEPPPDEVNADMGAGLRFWHQRVVEQVEAQPERRTALAELSLGGIQISPAGPLALSLDLAGVRPGDLPPVRWLVLLSYDDATTTPALLTDGPGFRRLVLWELAEEALYEVEPEGLAAFLATLCAPMDRPPALPLRTQELIETWSAPLLAPPRCAPAPGPR
jgi:hypothetical protein